MSNTDVKKQGEYDQLEMVLDEQILMIIKMLAVLAPAEHPDQREAKDI